ncbi:MULTISPECIES: hypothetical protein [unclassified Leifsonia]|uniref:hypothetical protein n=1 Tax=unclassified Leifsonia TaxID=2663824 RepID=UPI0008A7BC4C|nr:MULTISPECIES: hypothetical protein [unclassified Leifsonia]SEH96770.1 hypothetical protein SAMN04515694_10832 [Leifsonia sp. CL154]SFL64008.1 hypothetical protein SAMN04515692_108104 [Leifsonia sp. CL147]
MSRPIQREGSRQIRGWHITAAVLLAGAVMIAVVVLVGIPETPPPSPAGTNAVLTTRGTGPGDMVDWHVHTVTGIDEQGNVTLRNPWGPGDDDHPEYLHLTFDEMCRAGWYANIGAPPK